MTARCRCGHVNHNTDGPLSWCLTPDCPCLDCRSGDVPESGPIRPEDEPPLISEQEAREAPGRGGSGERAASGG